ncbi:MAG: CPBP family intramembrane metalloprotease, partial [Phycisphaeraceae bacterium]|nr:CPBP family intramembrane metalloprotease [Phycisphaeraceae bacterium]
LWVYVLGAIYWCTINSILEEYVWRWFVFTRCEALVGQVPATIVSALLFTIHHVIALMAFFDWRVTILASLGVFIGSAMWSWLYLRYRNLWTAYVCHVFADVGIFVIGWRLIFW